MKRSYGDILQSPDNDHDVLNVECDESDDEIIKTISINQNLENNEIEEPLIWWRLLLFVPLLLTLIQSFIGVRLSSTWSAHICLSFN